jgi:hypothetical protein
MAVSIGAFLLAWVLWGEENTEPAAPMIDEAAPPVTGSSDI